MALMQITVIPLGTGNPSVGDHIADIEAYLQERGIEHRLHDMGTIVAGTTEELLKLAGDLHRIPLARGVQRVVTNITLDERLDRHISLGEKQNAVNERLKTGEKP